MAAPIHPHHRTEIWWGREVSVLRGKKWLKTQGAKLWGPVPLASQLVLFLTGIQAIFIYCIRNLRKRTTKYLAWLNGYVNWRNLITLH